MIIAIDLDGTLAEYHGFQGLEHIGAPLTGAVAACKVLAAAGHSLMVFSCRTCDAPTIGPSSIRNEREVAAAAIAKWLAGNGFPQMSVWTGDGKPFADVYIDDRALRVAPQDDAQAWAKALAFFTVGITPS